MQTEAIQKALAELDLGGWLVYDFRGNNRPGRRVLGLADEQIGSRRFFYCIPRTGEPRKLVHRIESQALDHLPGERNVYLTWQELQSRVGELVEGLDRVAMEYSPKNAIPYVSTVDAGTVELVRGHGVEVVSSGDLIQMFEATLSEKMWRLHQEASIHTHAAFDLAWLAIGEAVRAGRTISEAAVCDLIMQHFERHGMTTYHPPIVAVNTNSGDPHYETGTGEITQIGQGDFVLIDLWAKLDDPDGVYSDLTRVGFIGESVPPQHAKIFQIVAAARDAAIDRVRTAFADKEAIQGWEVDRAARDVIERAGYGRDFVHRTGHSIGRETHGNGANIDDLETHDERRILRRTLFSIEPGIYLPDFGIRSEVDVFVDAEGRVHVTGGEVQKEVRSVL